jgi:ribose-phosphate pyrophosphokinase
MSTGHILEALKNPTAETDLGAADLAEVLTPALIGLIDERARQMAMEIIAAQNGLYLATGSSNPCLAKKIAYEVERLQQFWDPSQGINLSELELPLLDPLFYRPTQNLDLTMLRTESDPAKRIYADGEVAPKYDKTRKPLKTQELFIIQSPSPPNIHDHLMELLMMIDAAKRSSAKRVVVVLPYTPYARADRKTLSGTSIGISLILNLIETAGADEIITVDLHAKQSAGSVGIPISILHTSLYMIPAIKAAIGSNNAIVVSPDIGGAKTASKYAEFTGYAGDIDQSVGAILKTRDPETGKSTSSGIIGDVNDKDVIMPDDMIAGAGTICDGARVAKRNGARRIFVVAPHALLLGDAIAKINASPIDRVYISDSIKHRPEVVEEICREDGKFKVISVAQLLAAAILNVHTGARQEGLFLS